MVKMVVWVCLFFLVCGCGDAPITKKITIFVATPYEVYRKDGNEISQLISWPRTPKHQITAVAYSPAKGWLAIARGPRILWVDERGKIVIPERQISSNDSIVSSMAFSRDGGAVALLIASGNGKEIGLLELDNFRLNRILRVNNSSGVSFGPGSSIYYSDYVLQKSGETRVPEASDIFRLRFPPVGENIGCWRSEYFFHAKAVGGEAGNDKVCVLDSRSVIHFLDESGREIRRIRIPGFGYKGSFVSIAMIAGTEDLLLRKQGFPDDRLFLLEAPYGKLVEVFPPRRIIFAAGKIQ